MSAELLRAVLEDPHDDMPRLVYADWLDERGGAKRANFIRQQIRFNGCITLRYERQGATVTPSILPFHKLIGAWEDSRNLPIPGAISYTFRRGFVDEIAAESADFLKLASTIFSMQPVTRVEIVNVQFPVHREPASVVEISHPSHPWRLNIRGHESLSAACVRYGRMGAGLLRLAASPDQAKSAPVN